MSGLADVRYGHDRKSRSEGPLVCAPGNAIGGRPATKNAPMATLALESAIARAREVAELGGPCRRSGRAQRTSVSRHLRCPLGCEKHGAASRDAPSLPRLNVFWRSARVAMLRAEGRGPSSQTD